MLIPLLLVGCAPDTALLAPCTLEPDPPVGELTDDFASQDMVACSDADPLGWAIYVGGVDAIEGASADLRFRKTTSDPSGAPLSTIEWFLLLDSDGNHECVDVGTDRVIDSGEWEMGQEELLVPGVPVFASMAELDAAEEGATVAMYLATTGSDEPGVRRWWQKDSLTFTRSCPEDAQ